MKTEPPRESATKAQAQWLGLAYLGPHFLVCTIFGYGIGYFLDDWTGMTPIWTYIWSGFGIAAGFVALFREVARINRLEEEALREQMEAEEGACDAHKDTPDQT